MSATLSWWVKKLLRLWLLCCVVVVDGVKDGGVRGRNNRK